MFLFISKKNILSTFVLTVFLGVGVEVYNVPISRSFLSFSCCFVWCLF